MPYLTSQQLSALSNAIIKHVGYSPNIREIFLSEVNLQFKLMLDVDQKPKIQLDLDLISLNKTERLTDGTIPFYSWLQHAQRYAKLFPEASRIVDECLAIVEGKSIKAAPVADGTPPSAAVIGKIEEERIIHGDNLLSFAWLEAGVRAGIGVGRINIRRYDNGQLKTLPNGGAAIYSGTAWMLTRNLVITNYHVIEARDDNEPDASSGDLRLQGENATVDFDYNADSMVGYTVKLASLEAANADLDYAILRLKERVDRLPPARMPNQIKIIETDPQAVNIIQHPYGLSKKVAFRDNHLFESPYPKVRYFTDTEKGSSGSPVFNDRWQVVALHRASQLVNDVLYQGKVTGWVNEGIQLKAIFDHLKENYTHLDTEILNAG